MSDQNDTTLSRRDFLQLAGAGLALGATSPVQPGDSAGSGSQFAVKLEQGAIVSLKRVGDTFDTDYVQSGRRLGDAIVRYRRGPGAWQTIETSTFTDRALSSSNNNTQYSASYKPANAAFELRIEFVVEESALQWRIVLTNLGNSPSRSATSPFRCR
jgi:hypothetical protein